MNTNIFTEVAHKIKNNKIVILFFLASVAMLASGINHFIEDTISSLYGIQELEATFGVIPATYQITYWTMSLAPQLAQVVFAYLYMVDGRKNKWALWMTIAALVVDFVADAWYRSNQQLLERPGVFIVASVLTLVYFTIGSEVFITVGGGLTLELLGPALHQFAVFVNYTLDEVMKPSTQRRPSSPQNNRRSVPQPGHKEIPYNDRERG